MALDPALRMPKRIDAPAASRQSLIVNGALEARDLPRLAEVDWQVTQPFTCTLQFGQLGTAGGWLCGGQLHGELSTTCQRCLAPMTQQVELKWRWQLARNEAAAEQCEEECWVLDDEQWLDVRTAIEDELLLSLPLAPRHSTGSGCVPKVRTEATKEAKQQVLRKPFAEALAGLKRST